VVIKHLRKLLVPRASNFRDADGLLVHTSHVFIAFDVYAALYHIHWYDMHTGNYYMEEFGSAIVTVEQYCIELRSILRNLQDWVMESRIGHTRRTLDQLYDRLVTESNAAPPAKKRKRGSGM
jgi:hypothetical protein